MKLKELKKDNGDIWYHQLSIKKNCLIEVYYGPNYTIIKWWAKYRPFEKCNEYFIQEVK